MAHLSIKVDGKDIRAESMLKIATQTVKLLRAIEKNQTGKKSVADWKVQMMTGPSYGLIDIWADGNDAVAPTIEATWKEAARRMSDPLR